MNEVDMKKVIEESFTQYSGAVLQSRALVDVRDCLKPSARQIFFSLYDDKFLSSKPFKKTLKAIGSVARFYIHGDASAEGIIMRAGQNFAMRYPLIEVEGNDGNLMLSGNWAAPRYTASRLSPAAESLFEDIDKETISDWRLNYDDTEKYPGILPSKGFYNIVNGTMGIGIGASSSIPQFNIKDVNNALIHLLKNPTCSFDDIYCVPDFATGALLYNEPEVKECLKYGKGGSCKLRAVIDYDRADNCLIVKEIPYSVYTNTICGELEAIIADEEHNPGIDRFNDLTGETPNIKIYLLKNARPEVVKAYLFKNTSLQYHFTINMTMLEDGKYPKVFGWREALSQHIKHEKEVYKRGFEFDLRKIEARLHIIEGLLICIANIDEVVQIIRNAESSAAAALKLQSRFNLDSEQTKAILAIKLGKLAHLEVNELKDEQQSLRSEAGHIHEILTNVDMFNQCLIDGWTATMEQLGDDRRTKVIVEESEEAIENPTVSANDWTLALNDLSVVSIAEDEIEESFKKTGQYGKLHPINGMPNCGKEVRGLLADGTTAINTCGASGLLFRIDPTKEYVVTISKAGVGKKTAMAQYKRFDRLCKIKEGDEIAFAVCCNNSDRIVIRRADGKVLSVGVDKIKDANKITIGNKIVDGVMSACLATEMLYTVTTDTHTKRFLSSEITGVSTNVVDDLQFIGCCESPVGFYYNGTAVKKFDWSGISVKGRSAVGAKLATKSISTIM